MDATPDAQSQWDFSWSLSFSFSQFYNSAMKFFIIFLLLLLFSFKFFAV
jgi:hypothetical protein